jgi:glycosyltransferase involved in cell wall biosynthesis
MKILFHTSYYQRLAGANRSFLELIKNLDRNKYTTLTVFTNDGPVCQYYKEQGLDIAIFPLPDTLNTHGKRLLRLNLPKILRLIFFELLPLTFRFAAYLHKEKVDLVHVRDARSLLLLGIAARLAGKPIFCHIRGELPDVRLLPLFIGLISHRVITVNQVLTSAIPRFFRKKCEVIYNSISESSFPEQICTSELLVLQKGIIHVSMFAMVIKGKGVDTFVDAVELLGEKNKNVIFHVVGDTNFTEDYYLELSRRVACRNLPIQFEGWRNDPQNWYRQSDIIVLPTRSEGFPRTILEAMYFAKPVIATRVGGIPELVIDQETGFLFDVDDIETFSKKLQLLITDPHLMRKMGAAGKERVEKYFSTKIMIGKMQSLYDNYKR